VTEAEWLACNDPRKMLEYLRGKASDRKLQLFAVACCRHVWHLMEEEVCRSIVEVVERYADYLGSSQAVPLADALASSLNVSTLRSRLRQLRQSDLPDTTLLLGFEIACLAATAAVWMGAWAAAWKAGPEARRAFYLSTGKSGHEEARVQAALLRDIFGNLFRPVSVDPSWLAWSGGTVPRMAQAIYDNRAFDRLPNLADALEEAGCTNPDILAHCRQPREHVRGCWLVDLLLGKS
jgi:hypothetical protein